MRDWENTSLCLQNSFSHIPHWNPNLKKTKNIKLLDFIFLPRFSIAIYGLISAFKKCEFGKNQNYKVVAIEVTILESPTWVNWDFEERVKHKVLISAQIYSFHFQIMFWFLSLI